jgi:ribosomal-protein-alanine N-acetyltransferase
MDQRIQSGNMPATRAASGWSVAIGVFRMKQPDLTTDRLLLRAFKLSDAIEVQKLSGNYNVSKTTLNIPYPYKSGMAETWIGTHLENWNNRTVLTYAIISIQTNQLLGAIGLVKIDGLQGELGYWLGEPYWDKGYGTEAAKAIIQFSFEKLRLRLITAEHLISNPASGKVMQKAGMYHVETTKKPDRYGKLADLDIYEIRKT